MQDCINEGMNRKIIIIISSNPQCTINNIYYLIRNYQTCKKIEKKIFLHKKNNQSVETDPQLVE